jgi:hypothetical protein
MRIMALVALLATLSFSPAVASPLGEAFIHLCGETRGDSFKALALASSEGWIEPHGDAGSVGAVIQQSRMKNIDGGRLLLSAQTIAGPNGAVAHACMVSEVPDKPIPTRPDPRAYRDELQAWVGFDPLKNGDDGAGVQFAFRETATGRAAAPPSPPGRGPSGPDIAFVVAWAFGGAPTITYIKPS